jgi:hypothetical protein
LSDYVMLLFKQGLGEAPVSALLNVPSAMTGSLRSR